MADSPPLNDLSATEPAALAGLVQTAITQIILVLVAFSVLDVSNIQLAAVQAALAATLAVPVWLYVRHRVTPNGRVAQVVAQSLNKQQAEITTYLNNYTPEVATVMDPVKDPAETAPVPAPAPAVVPQPAPFA